MGAVAGRVVKPSVSAVVNTRNAERYLDYTLRSLAPWTEEIVVVDMASEDRTLDIARSHGARILDHPPAGFVEPARVFAVSHARNEWVVVVDADELIPKRLSDELLATAERDDADVVFVPRRNYIAGAALTNTGWGPDQDLQPRFFRKGALEFSDEIHSVPRPSAGARVTKLKSSDGLAITHFNYVDLFDFVDRMNRYTNVEAEQLLERSKKPPSKGLVRALGTFVRRYVKGRGYRDGWRGLYLSLLMAFYRVLIHAKARERHECGDEGAVLEAYRREAEALLQEYS